MICIWNGAIFILLCAGKWTISVCTRCVLTHARHRLNGPRETGVNRDTHNKPGQFPWVSYIGLALLRYVSEGNFRQTIRAETTKVESYNDFTDWIIFGGELIKSGDPVEQNKQIKYTDLIANAIMLQNVVDLTDVLNTMSDEGIPVTKELVAGLSPYVRDHIRRFGRYDVNMDHMPPDLVPKSVNMPP